MDFSIRQLSKKMLALILASVFVVSGSITAVLVFAQVTPAVRRERAAVPEPSSSIVSDGSGNTTFQPGTVPPKRQADGQAYADNWSLAIDSDASLTVDVMAVDVELTAHNGSELLVDFEGWAYPLRTGELPQIMVSGTSSGIIINETRTQSQGMSFYNNEGALDGVLRIQIPQGSLGYLNIDTFSGRIAAADLNTGNLVLDTSSGNVELLNTTSAGTATVETFSGSVRLENITAAGIEAGASSGSLHGSSLTANKLTSSTFSGDITLIQATIINGATDLETSSGNITIDNSRFGGLDANTFSGTVVITDAEADGDITADTSSGDVTLTDASGKALEVSTFSGSLTGERLDIQEMDVSTSSGEVKAELLQGCDISVDTFSGSVELIVPQDYGFRLEFETFSGSHSIGFPITLDGQGSGKDIRGVVGSGEYEVEVSTSSGDLTIQPAH